MQKVWYDTAATAERRFFRLLTPHFMHKQVGVVYHIFPFQANNCIHKQRTQHCMLQRRVRLRLQCTVSHRQNFCCLKSLNLHCPNPCLILLHLLRLCTISYSTCSDCAPYLTALAQTLHHILQHLLRLRTILQKIQFSFFFLSMVIVISSCKFLLVQVTF